MDTLNIPQARIGQLIDGYANGPSAIVRRFWDGWTWCYELDNGAILEQSELPDK